MLVSFDEGKPSRNLWAAVLAILFIVAVIVNEISGYEGDISVGFGFLFIGWLVFGNLITDRYIRKQRKNNDEV